MQQYAFQNNNQINNNQQPQNNNNNNNNINNGNVTIQHQMNQAQQIQQYSQGQINQLHQMQQQFNQFNQQQQQQPQNQQNTPQNQPPLYAQQQSPQNTQNQQMQQNVNLNNANNNFAPNQIQLQPSTQLTLTQAQNQNPNQNSPPQPQNNINVVWTQAQAPQTQVTQPFQQIGLPQQQIIQLDGSQQIPQQIVMNGDLNNNNNNNNNPEAKVEVEQSTLNPEVAAFNPFGGQGQGQAAIQQQNAHEQLFNQLQNILRQMQSIKYQTDSVLTPTLIQLNQQMAILQSNPALLQIQTNQVHYFTIQQNQMIITAQINQNQMSYQQLEQNLKYTQDMYQKNKDEQYVVPGPQGPAQTLLPGEESKIENNNNVINLNNDSNDTQGNTFNLTRSGDYAWTQQPQTQEENTQEQNVQEQPPQPENDIQIGQDIEMSATSEGGGDDDGDSDEAPSPQDENLIETQNDSQSNPINHAHTIEYIDDEEEITSEDVDTQENENNNSSPDINTQDENDNENENDNEYEVPSPPPLESNISPFTRKISKFGSSATHVAKPFGHSIIAEPPNDPIEPHIQPPIEIEIDLEIATESPPTPSPDNIAQPINPITHTKSLIFASNTLKKPMMEKASSYSSQPSNASSDTTPQLWRDRRVQDEGKDNENYNDNNDTDVSKEINVGQVCYDVMDLVKVQKDYLSITWSNFTDLPRSVRMVSKGVNPERYMEDVVAMFMRKSANPWLAASHTGKAPKDRHEKLIKKLTGILNKMTPEKFAKIAKSSMDIVNDFAETRDQMQIIIDLVLQFGIKQPVFGGQYALLCSHLHAHLPKLGMICEYAWVVEDNDVSSTFRKMVIQQTNELFTKHLKHTAEDGDRESEEEGKELNTEQIELRKKKKKRNFFAVMVLVAELYNVELIKRNLVFKGVFEILLKKPSAVDLEGLCQLFKRCGAKLDVEAKKYVDKYLQKLISHANKFDFRTKVLVDEIKEMRANGWEHRLKKEVAKTQDEIREDFEKEQMAKNKGPRRDRYDDRRHRKRDDYYEEDYGGYGYDEDYNASRGSHGYSASNLRKVKVDRYSSRGGGGGGSGGGGRRDGRSRSSMNLRSDFKKSRHYDNNNSWGNDDSVIDSRSKSNKSNGNGRYKMKKISPSPAKTYGMYQKKSNSGGGGVIKKCISDPVGMERNGGQSYGDSDMIKSLSGYIDEYMASGVIDDILDLNCSDFKVWASVINNGLRDRKSDQIRDFIELILELFEQNILNNQGANFVNIVVKYLVIRLDDSSMDCPNFTKYVAELFANLCYQKYLNPDPCYNYFIKKYNEYSEYSSFAKKKTINKIIKYSVTELNNLQASHALISHVQRKAL